MRNRIFGVIGILWGGGMLVSMLMRGGAQGHGAYAAGQFAGMALGAVMLVAGPYAVLTKA